MWSVQDNGPNHALAPNTLQAVRGKFMITLPKTSAITFHLTLFLFALSGMHSAQAQFFVPPDPQPNSSQGNYPPTPSTPQYDSSYPSDSNYPPYKPTPQRPDPGIEFARELIKALTTPPPKPPRPIPPRPTYIYPKQIVQPQLVAPPKPQLVEPLKNQVIAQPLTPLANITPLSLTKKADRRLIADMQKQVDWATNDAAEGLQAVLDRRKPPIAESVAAATNGRPLQDQQRLLESVKAGDTDVVDLATAGNVSPEAERIREYARAAAALKKAVEATKAGKLDDALRQSLQDALATGGFVPDLDSVLPFYAMLDTANDVACVLSKAQPNAPLGPVDCILFVGNMPSSDVIFLGGGSCLVGTGGETSGVTLADATLGQALDMNIEAGSPVPDDNGDAVLQDSVITNRGSTTVNFVANNSREKLTPGQAKTFLTSATSRIEFYPSESAGKKTYRLEKAGYEFRLTDGTWGIFKVTHTITIDNSENSMDFQYVAENAHAVVKAGQTSVITSPYPIVLRFDDGTGTLKQKRLTKGVFKVAITSRGSLELFAAENVSSPRPVEDIIADTSIDIFGRWTKDKGLLPNSSNDRKPTDAVSSAPKLFD